MKQLPTYVLVLEKPRKPLHLSDAPVTERQNEVERVVRQALLRVEETNQLLSRMDKFFKDFNAHIDRIGQSPTEGN